VVKPEQRILAAQSPVGRNALTGVETLYGRTRAAFVAATSQLLPDDMNLQAEVFTSPPKWHLAHTSWFFETFLLKPYLSHYQTPNQQYQVIFNSYYNGIGKQHARAHRGLLSRPTVEEVMAYRNHIDSGMAELFRWLEACPDHPDSLEILARAQLGIQHEQQHMELFYTDLKYCFFQNPLLPAYQLMANTPRQLSGSNRVSEAKQSWVPFDPGLIEIGAALESDRPPFSASSSRVRTFAFDNESPRHRVFLSPFELSSRLVTNEEYQAFIDDGGYQRSEFWLADAWAWVQQQGWERPLYWLEGGDEFSLLGVRPRAADEPVSHVSGYEADAFASWMAQQHPGVRLATEFEWEFVANQAPDGPKDLVLHPPGLVAEGDSSGVKQMFGSLWQWTGSAYRPYPGFQAASGAIGEYNGKFMCNQWVLRGSSCVTSPGHSRSSYRNISLLLKVLIGCIDTIE
jgi:ergothioneine biosynthesis protein EgtB